MKIRNLVLLLIVVFSGNLVAGSLADYVAQRDGIVKTKQNEENKWGYYLKQDWQNAGVDSKDEAMQWNSLGYRLSEIRAFKNLKALPKDVKPLKELCNSSFCIREYLELKISVSEIKQWQSLCDEAYCISVYKKLGMDYNEANKWKDINLNDIKTWFSLGVKDVKLVKAWIKVTGKEYPLHSKDWIEAGIKDPREATKWMDAGVNPYTLGIAKKANLTMKDIKEWKSVGLHNIDMIIKVIKIGLDEPDDYEPYKGIPLNHIVKLRNWDIEPNDLIRSMSYSNSIFGRELYFTSEDKFKKAYSVLEDHCDEVEKDKWFASVNISENKNRCFIFTGKMKQRLDEKSMFSGITQKGLVRGTGGKYFFADDFEGNWGQGNTKVGVIKGNGSYSYESRSGNRIVPNGTVIYMK